MSSLARPPKVPNLAAAEQRLIAGMFDLGLEYSADQLARLMQYLALLVKWNQAYNLSAIRDPLEMVTLHLLDSLAVIPYVRAERILDVGSGAGLPGIPLAIFLPSSRITMIDSAGKKMRFVFHVIHELQLTNAEALHARVENLSPVDKFDGIISRAFASIPDFLAVSSHLLTDEGTFWAMKGQNPDAELSAMPKHYIVAGFHPLQLPGLSAERCLVPIKRQAAGI
jgi:16S rRNA (guanine527-N7)-methyltransferase